jgi:YD repeat-containing protein
VSSNYDAADRLQASGTHAGLAYDAFGRVTTLPAADTGATAATLAVSYYTNNLVRSESQNGRTLTWSLDAGGRLKSRADSANSAATQTNHFDAPGSDAPSWVAASADSRQWTRAVPSHGN